MILTVKGAMYVTSNSGVYYGPLSFGDADKKTQTDAQLKFRDYRRIDQETWLPPSK